MKKMPQSATFIYIIIFLSYLRLLDIFQNRIPKVSPPIGLLSDKNVVIMIDPLIGSLLK
jgi:hypothetical protein